MAYIQSIVRKAEVPGFSCQEEFLDWHQALLKRRRVSHFAVLPDHSLEKIMAEGSSLRAPFHHSPFYYFSGLNLSGLIL